SQDSFTPGQFYHVAGTYDGATFRLFVNGALQGQLPLVKTITYTSLGWSIGSSVEPFRSEGFPRTWNGVIDEVQIFSRALSASEIQSIVNAGGFGECKGPPAIAQVIPQTGQQGQQALSVSITGQFTHFVQGITT